MASTLTVIQIERVLPNPIKDLIYFMNFKSIHIGQLIEQGVKDNEIEVSRICNFFKCSQDEVREMYLQKSLDSEILLRWSKLLEYDFFRLYSQHLILYAPPTTGLKTKNQTISLPQFRKNVYTKEVIDFILEQIHTGEMSKIQITEKYKIPKTTLYKWINKYKK